MKALPRFFQITDLTAVTELDLRSRLAAAHDLPPAARAQLAVLVREPQLTGRDLLAFATRTRDHARALGVGFWVTARADVAALLDADGVHLGRGALPIAAVRALLPRAAISVSCHGLDELDALLAAPAGAPSAERPDALVLSPIFASPGKGAPLGVAALTAAAARCQKASVALVALGGVDETSHAIALAGGADAVAAIRADCAAMLRRAAVAGSPAPPAA